MYPGRPAHDQQDQSDPSAADARIASTLTVLTWKTRDPSQQDHSMPLSKPRPSPRPSATSSFSDTTNKSGPKLTAENKDAPSQKRHERQNSRALLLPQSGATLTTTTATTSIIPTKYPIADGDVPNENDENDLIDDSGAIGASASTGGRFTRPDYLLHGLLARARNRVKDRTGRDKEKGNGDVSQDFDKLFTGIIPDETPTISFITASHP